MNPPVAFLLGLVLGIVLAAQAGRVAYRRLKVRHAQEMAAHVAGTSTIAARLRSQAEYLGDQPVARTPEGAPITCVQLAALIDAEDPLGVAFVEDVMGAAVRMVKVANRQRVA